MKNVKFFYDKNGNFAKSDVETLMKDGFVRIGHKTFVLDDEKLYYSDAPQQVGKYMVIEDMPSYGFDGMKEDGTYLVDIASKMADLVCCDESDGRGVRPIDELICEMTDTADEQLQCDGIMYVSEDEYKHLFVKVLVALQTKYKKCEVFESFSGDYKDRKIASVKDGRLQVMFSMLWRSKDNKLLWGMITKSQSVIDTVNEILKCN